MRPLSDASRTNCARLRAKAGILVIQKLLNVTRVTPRMDLLWQCPPHQGPNRSQEDAMLETFAFALVAIAIAAPNLIMVLIQPAAETRSSKVRETIAAS